MHRTAIFNLAMDEESVLAELVNRGGLLDMAVLSRALGAERAGLNRKPVLIALTRLYRNLAEDSSKIKPLTLEWIKRKSEIAYLRTRRNFARRTSRTAGLFALHEIGRRYPGYTEKMLLADLARKPGKVKRIKRKTAVDLRRCQMEKLAALLRTGNLSEAEYNKTCCRVASLEQAHQLHLPIRLTVRLNGQSLVYSFAWKTREKVIKAFVELANTRGVTHERLEARYREIVNSRNSV